jgi:anti-anti-sigma regulatory factor
VEGVFAHECARPLVAARHVSPNNFRQMSTPTAKMSVLVGDRFSCIKIAGRANFNSSVDFKTLVNELRNKGFHYFILDLSECMLMDSTFLGVLTGFGLKMNAAQSNNRDGSIELLNANSRITELLENLGVLHLFRVTQGTQTPEGVTESFTPEPCHPTKEEVTRACLEAHRTLMEVNPQNVPRFKDVAQFLAEDLKKLKGGA